jgi:hypothetical protein
MSIFIGLGTAPTFEKGTFFNAGSAHDVMVRKTILKESQQSGLGFIAETDILTSAATGEVHPDTRVPFVPLPAGIDGTWWQSMTDTKIALPAIKVFIMAVLGLDTNDPRRGMLEQLIPGSEAWQIQDEKGRIFVSGRPLALIESVSLWATSEANVLSGLYVHLDTKYTKTRKGGDFTIHNWSPLNFAAFGVQPPNLDQILGQCRNPPPIASRQAPPAWGQPPAGPTAPATACCTAR